MLASVNIMSTEISKKKKYELRARADSQRQTRDRIACAAADLHEEKGVARTTVVEIARRAGVSRLTVYNHFPDLESLLPACAAHYISVHPSPDFADAIAAEAPGERVVAVLTELYAWYRETEPLFGKLFSDRFSVPELDAFMTNGVDRMQEHVTSILSTAAGQVAGESAEHQRALARVAAEFWTWRRLSREGLADQDAARLMADVVLGGVRAGE